MKEKMILQIGENESEISSLKTEVKEAWKAEGNLVKDIASLVFYIKPDENKCYYVINDDFNGSIELI